MSYTVLIIDHKLGKHICNKFHKSLLSLCIKTTISKELVNKIEKIRLAEDTNFLSGKLTYY